MTKAGKSVSLDNELLSWVSKNHPNISEFINDLVLKEYEKNKGDPTLPLLSQEIQEKEEIIQKLTREHDLIIEQMSNLLRIRNKKFQEEQETQEKIVREKIEAEKVLIKEVKKSIGKLEGIENVIKEYKEDPERDAKWYIQKMLELGEKNSKEVGYSKLKLFLEKCI